MDVLFLVPTLHDRPTGGNIYNRRIIAELRRRGTAEVVPWTPGEAPVPSLPSTEESVLVVDSLLVRNEEALRALRAAHPSPPLVLLAHYLHCIDPSQRESSTAATERALLPLFDGAITTSPFARRALVKEGLPGGQVKAVSPGLDASYREPLPEETRDTPPHLLTVANLLPGKGLLEFVDGLAHLGDAAWRWTLIGDDTLAPDFAETVRARIRDAGLSDRVCCFGPVPPETLRARYDDAEVFVLPSRFETCSMSTREAMARGLPVVGYAVGGLPGNFGEARAGCLVSPDEPEALTGAVRRLLDDPGLRARMGTAARERSRSFSTWEEAGERFASALTTFRNRSL